jgi:hypothetical protein
MKFVHPEMLWGLLAVAIPIIVHLFNFRKFKRVMFPNVEFLKEIKQETHNKSKLKHLLILAARCLAIAAIVFAFAQPYIPVAGASAKPGGNAVSIYIDNSFSMEGQGRDGRLIDLAKNKAIEIVQSFSQTDKFQLLTSDFEGRHQRLVSRGEMTQLIQEVDVTPASRKLSEVVVRQADVLNKSGSDNKRAFLLTDLQSSVTDIEAVKSDSTIRYYVVPEKSEDLSNVYIDSVWFDSPVRQLNQPEVLNMRVVNTGDDAKESVPVYLSTNGQQKSVATVQIPAKGSVETQMNYTNTDAGLKDAMLSVEDGAIAKDDQFYFAYNVAQQIAVLELRGTNASNVLSAVFADDPYFSYAIHSENNIDFGAFAKHHLIVLNQLQSISTGLTAELEKFVQAGGSVYVIPSAQTDIVSYNALLSKLGLGQLGAKRSDGTKVGTISYDHFIFKNAFEKTTGNVDMPIVHSWYEISLPSKSVVEPMLTMQNGMPFLVSTTAGLGRAYLSAVSLATEESNFIHHALFPATALRMAEFSQPTYPLYYFLGKEQAVLLRNLNLSAEETLRLRNTTSKEELIPEHRNAGAHTEVFIHATLQEAGNYQLLQANEPVAVLAFNYDRLESDTRAWSLEELESKIQTAGLDNWNVLSQSVEHIAAGAVELSEGKKYWYTLIVLALIFLAIEVLLIKFWR